MLTKDFIEKNRKRLQEEKHRLEGLLSRIGKKDDKAGDFHPTYPDFGNQADENASEVAEYGEKIAEDFDLEQKLRKVETALLRIENGTYGICQAGKEPIPEARLEAVPEAENCVEHEKG